MMWQQCTDTILSSDSDGNDQKEVNVLNNLLAKQVDSIIFMGHHITDEMVNFHVQKLLLY